MLGNNKINAAHFSSATANLACSTREAFLTFIQALYDDKDQLPDYELPGWKDISGGNPQNQITLITQVTIRVLTEHYLEKKTIFLMSTNIF